MFDRPYSRTLEVEADQVGLQLAAKVGGTRACRNGREALQREGCLVATLPKERLSCLEMQVFQFQVD